MEHTLDIKAISAELMRAQQERVQVSPLTERFPEMTVEQAYQVQLTTIQTLLAGGRRVVGKKIGLTSKAMQQLLGVSDPDYGFILDDMVVLNGQPAPASKMIQPRCEGEVLFILKKDLSGPGVTVTDVLQATGWVMPVLEIVDSRIRDWKIKLVDTVADNASSCMVVLGNRMTPVDEVDLRLVGMVFEKNGEITGTGTGAACLGHPASAVAWLANKLHEYGTPLKAGEFILSGALTAAPNVAPGDFCRAEFDRLGSVSVRFV